MQIYRRTQVEIDPIEFGQLLRELRKKDGRNVQTLATCAGLSQKWWYDLEKGVAGSLEEAKLRGIERTLNHDFGVVLDGRYSATNIDRATDDRGGIEANESTQAEAGI